MLRQSVGQFTQRIQDLMFFRFGGALVLLVLIALAGIAIEKQNLTLRRTVSHQKFRQDVLLEEHAIHRLKAQQLGAPSRLFQDLPQTVPHLTQPGKKVNSQRFVRPKRSLPAAMLDEDSPTH